MEEERKDQTGSDEKEAQNPPSPKKKPGGPPITQVQDEENPFVTIAKVLGKILLGILAIVLLALVALFLTCLVGSVLR